ARSVLDPSFQKDFNLNKGSIPVRLDADMAPFDSCACGEVTVLTHAKRGRNRPDPL
ncbi:glucose ABC transport system, periplasmic sugar-binding protein, partial [Pseudomonas phage vB_Pae_CF57b]